jgi:hypothetical protein
VKIYGLLSWWDEPEDWLRECVESLTTATPSTPACPIVDHLIALDGAYAAFPYAQHCSAESQVAAIREAASEAGIGCDVVIPDTAWQGNEVEKRAHLLHLAHQHATPYEDWFMVIDADMRVEEAHGVRASLRSNKLDSALSTLSEPATSMKWKNWFRAIPGLTVEGHHARYVTPDGRVLWNGHYGSQEPGLEVYVVIDHTRSARRAEDKATYGSRTGDV